MDNGDGTYSYPPALDFDPGDEIVRGAVTWRYGRQARYSWEPTEWQERVSVDDASDRRTRLDRMFGRRMFDSEGREWAVHDIDLELWSKRLGREAPADEIPAESYASSATGEVVSWQPTAWSNGCTGGTGFVDKIWDSEDRNKKTSITDRQKGSAVVVRNNGIVCSGVFLSSTVVLTAAHCVVDEVAGSDTTVPVGQLEVCSWGNMYGGSCVTVATNEPATDYDGEGGCLCDVKDDWAILELSSSVSGIVDMDMTTATSMGSKEIKEYGFPQFDPSTCNNNTGTPSDSDVPDASFLYHQDGVDMTDYIGEKARWTADGMNGQSGSPVFHCDGSDNVCDPGETGMVAAVWSAFEDGTTDRFAGPRVPAFRDEALAEIND